MPDRITGQELEGKENIMIIQNSTSQAVLPVRRVSDVAPEVAAEATKTSAKQDNARQPSTEQLKSAVSDINKAMHKSSQNLEFSVDSASKKPVVRMVDSETGQLIRQIPSQETLAIAQSIDRFQHGSLFKQQA
jgi:flagellar protein FlaG